MQTTALIRKVAFQAAIWTAVGVVFAVPSILRDGGPMASLSHWWLWGFVPPLVLWLDIRLPYSDKQLPKRLLAFVVLGFFLVPLFEAICLWIQHVQHLANWDWRAQPTWLLDMYLSDWLIFSLIVGVILARKYFRRYLTGELARERLERQFAEARLNALRMQLDPHFLFNALNAISSQVERDPKLARSMIEHLGDLLRLSLENRDKQQVPLSEEISFLEHYLHIQKIRFNDRLKIEMRVAPDVKHALVPCLILQPLAENAIRHGLSHRSSGGTLTISAGRVDHRIQINVSDDGVGLPPGWTIETSKGLGLSVTRERIAGHYPNGTSRFSVKPRHGGGTEVEISFPLRLVGESVDEQAGVLQTGTSAGPWPERAVSDGAEWHGLKKGGRIPA